MGQGFRQLSLPTPLDWDFRGDRKGSHKPWHGFPCTKGAGIPVLAGLRLPRVGLEATHVLAVGARRRHRLPPRHRAPGMRWWGRRPWVARGRRRRPALLHAAWHLLALEAHAGRLLRLLVVRLHVCPRPCPHRRSHLRIVCLRVLVQLECCA
jgi:hypothetical protein